MNQTLEEQLEKTIMFAIMDNAEEDPDLKILSEAISQLDDSLRALVSPEAWKMIMNREELEVDYRMKLVKNVLNAVGFRLEKMRVMEEI